MKAFSCAGLVMMVLFSNSVLAAEAPDYGKEVEFPLGDKLAGREVFKKYECFICHNVKHDSALPLPSAPSETRGPDLAPHSDRPLSLVGAQMKGLRASAGIPEPNYTAESYAASIMAPSHSIAPGFGKGSAEDAVQSPMKDFSSTMTVKELKDLVAYLTQAEA